MALPEMTIASRNIGDIFYTLRRDDTLNGAVPCDGREFNASDFDMDDPTNNPYSLCINGKIPNVDYTQYAAQIRSQGCCACFGIDVVNGRFKVPTIKDVYIKAGDVNTLTTYLAPGLPNITGGFHGSRGNGTFAWGAFTQGGANHTDTGRRNPTAPNNVMDIGFDASRSSAIYGRSSTVQPASLILRPMTQLLTAVAGDRKSDGDDTPDQPSITLKIPYIFVPGTEAKATEVNTNFEYVLRAIEGIAPSAAAVVHLEGDETISGKKTFLTSVSTPAIELIPSKSDTHGGYIDFHYSGAGVDYTARLIEAEKGFLSVMKSPASSDSSTKLATTEWVNNKVNTIASGAAAWQKAFPTYDWQDIYSGYVAPTYGWIRWKGTQADSSTQNLYIDGKQVFTHGSFKYADSTMFLCPVAAGSTVTYDGNSTAAFCKCIGS